MIEILKTGPLTLIQDLGRPGWGSVGVGRSGAADRGSLRLANRLVGNPEDSATLEVTFGGLEFRTTRPHTCALVGAPAPITVNGRAGEYAAPMRLNEGDVVKLGIPEHGLRSYLAFAGGIDVAPVLGSRSTDTMSGLGPSPLQPGVRLEIGHAQPQPMVDFVPVTVPPTEIEVRVLPGPRDEWLDDLNALATTAWRVSARSDRVGVRLEGEPLRRAAAFADAELASEGVVRGSIQVPTGGLPVLFLADHPVTGGYPVVGVLPEDDTDLVAQARPGQQLRFRILEG